VIRPGPAGVRRRCSRSVEVDAEKLSVGRIAGAVAGYLATVDRSAAWDVERLEGVVRVDLKETGDIAEADTDAIIAAVTDLLSHDGVRVVRLDGPALISDGPPDGLRRAIRSLDALAKRHGKRLVVGPI
jgi:hypothetical protein